MIATATSEIRFVRRTTLTAGETRYNFRQLDQDAIHAVTSKEARRVTNLMGHVYLCLINAPFKFRQSEGEIYFTGEVKDGKQITAWEQLTELLEVADGTALKSLKWMHEQGVIGYYARKNGVGIRIFINRAASSIKKVQPIEQKNLPPTRVAYSESHVSPNAMPFKEETREIVDKKIDSDAPKPGANANRIGDKNSVPRISVVTDPAPPPAAMHLADPSGVSSPTVISFVPPSVVAQLRAALEPQLLTMATQAAAREAAREGERTRQWLDKHGLPKAARVAQREAYNVFKHQTGKMLDSERARAELQVGQSFVTYPPPEIKSCTTHEINEIAEMCVTMLEVQGKPIDKTLSEICSLSGGWVLPEDIPKVREAGHVLIAARREGS